VITLFIPSGGGHWAVQGPFILPAAEELHASFAGTTMAVAMGEVHRNEMVGPQGLEPQTSTVSKGRYYVLTTT
jgi:short-chain fatty acids transporter